MKRTVPAAVVAITALTVSSPASAHPGHGLGGGSYSLLHYVTEPLHLLGGLVVVAAFASGAALLRGRRSTRAARLER
jgi:hypothetical protein